MDPNLRKAWTETVTPEDYDQHMTNNGQTPANAEILLETLQEWGLPESSELLIVGAGTCHFLEYPVASVLMSLRLILTDISPSFLEYARPRVQASGMLHASLIVDNIEKTTLEGPYDGVVAVLVLEHVEWEAGLLQLTKLAKDRLLIVFQKNASTSQPMLTGHMPVPKTMQVFGGEALPKPVDPEKLTAALAQHGFNVRRTIAKDVAQGKQMIGFLCERR